MLSRMFDHLGVAHVVAHDLARTEEALRPFYGDALLVSQSPWSRDAFRHIEALIHTADREGVLFESGTSGNDDLTLSHRIGMTYCTATMSDIARDIPDGALRIERLLRTVQN